jgi:hypothetical protein
MPFLKPIPVAYLVFFLRHRLEEAVAELVTCRRQVGISFDVVEFKTFVKFPIANGTKVRRMTISLLKMIGALHEALVPGAMTHAEHVSKFVSTNFDNSLKSHAIFELIALKFFSRKFRSESPYALNASECWDTISIAKQAQLFCK